METKTASSSSDIASLCTANASDCTSVEIHVSATSSEETPMEKEQAELKTTTQTDKEPTTPPPPTATTETTTMDIKTSTTTSVTFASEPTRGTALSFSSISAAMSLSTVSALSSFLTPSTTRRRRKRWNALEKARAQKGLVTSVRNIMGCGSSLDALYEDPMPIVVFGATGLVGGAVARALLRDRRFEVKAVTRTPTTDTARKLAEEGAVIVTGDLNYPRSLERVLEGAYAVFLVTHYWEHMNKEKEIAQGKNCVDAAVAAGVAHFVFCGSENPKEICDIECEYMEAKAAIENYVQGTDLPYTSFWLPFYFENFFSVFKPHKVKPGQFAIALPIEDKPMECISVKDVGRCVVNVLLRPKAHLCQVLPVTAEKLTVQQITDTFNKHFPDRKFICPRIGVKDYAQFGFKGAKDIAGMFEFYQTCQEPRDVKVTRKISGSLCSFDRWVTEHKQILMDVMDAPE